ncbi:MAG: hypothetical protein QOJ89_596, partial [bacterium]
QALDSAHTALALGCSTLVDARKYSSDLRARHRGLSHHTRTVLELLLAPVAVAVPAGEDVIERDDTSRHDWVRCDVDLGAYLQTTLPSRSMGREDPLFFASALAAGAALAQMTEDRTA